MTKGENPIGFRRGWIMKKMKKMKKIIKAVLCVALAFSMLTACGKSNESSGGAVSETVKMAVLNGPTGMAVVKMTDMTDKYDITAYQSPADITAKIISGEVDVAAVPSNLAAVLYNKTEGGITALTPIAMGMLQILGNNTDIDEIADLEGKTVIASGQGGTPEYVLQKILEEEGLALYKDVQVEWLANHSEVNTKLLSEEGAVAMIPEPFVSTALAAAEKNGKNVKSIFDLGSLWKDATGEELPMGVLIARKAFAEEKADDLKVLLGDLAGSADFVNSSPSEAAELIVEKGFIGDVEIAEAAIPNCGISHYTGKEGTEAGANILKAFNETMFEMNPASVGGAVPDENLYYREK